MVLRTEREVVRNVRSDRGMVSSIPYMSLEKRLRILPRGVVSKKDIGERITLRRSLSWILREAITAPIARAKEAKRTMSAWPKPKTAYTPRSSPL